MKTSKIAIAAIVLATLIGCNSGGGNTDTADTGDGNNPPVQYPDAGSTVTGDGGFDPGVIKVSCTASPEVAPVNTQVTITCTIDSGGRSVGTPTLSASPSAGTFLKNATELGVAYFALNTGTTGYDHPIDFADTVYTVTVQVKATTGEFGAGQVHVTVLGNYWIGDGSSTGQGIYVYSSDGANIGQAVGPAGIKAVTGLTMLPSGDIVASSAETKTIAIFSRKGEPVLSKFDGTDPFNGNLNIWEDLSFSNAGPQQMAISSTGELWVTGAAEKEASAQASTPGVAVFNPRDGSFQHFVPTPATNPNDLDYLFTSIARRSDGVMVVSSNASRTICLFDEKTYVSSGCTSVDAGFFSAQYSVMVPMANGQILVGTKSDDLAGLVLLSPTLAVVKVSAQNDQIDWPDMRGMVISGNDIVALGEYGESVGNTLLMRFNKDTFVEETPDWVVFAGKETLYNASGLVRLTPVGQ